MAGEVRVQVYETQAQGTPRMLVVGKPPEFALGSVQVLTLL
jgi:hypothetical protein